EVDPGANHLQESVLREVGVAGVIERVGEGPGQSDALVELADGQQSGVAGELTRRGLDDERRAEEVHDLWPGGWYTHRMSPGGEARPFSLPGEPRAEVKDSEPRARSAALAVPSSRSRIRGRR